MSRIELFSLLLQLFVPLALIARVGLARGSGRLTRVLDAAVAVSYLAAIALAAPWLVLPWYLPWVLGILLLGAVVAGGRRWRSYRREGVPHRAARVWAGMLLRAGALSLLVGTLLVAVAGRRPLRGEAIALEFPLRGGTYLVVNGGSRKLINAHLETLEAEPRYRPYRGQSWALDLVRVGGWGSRRRAISPGHPDGFTIYGDSLFAPCAGWVIEAEDGHPDQRAAGEKPATLAGNHVLLECGEAWVLLAHMRRGSVLLRAGDSVKAGDWLGEVGNSGRSDEPHLHLHAQTPGTVEAPLGGEPLPIAFGGMQPVRNQRIRTR